MSGTRREPELRFPGWLPPALLLIGAVLAAVGLAALVQRYVLAASGVSEGMGLFDRHGDMELGLPAVLMLFASVPLFIGELIRRGAWSTRVTSAARGGSVLVRMVPLRLGFVLAWALVPLLCWLLLIGIPVAAVLTGTGFTSASDDFWDLAAFYGFVAAAIVGAFVGSLVERAAFARARGRVAPTRGREFWRVVAGQMRAESFLLAAGVGCLGVLPLLVRHAAAREDALDMTAVIALTGVGALLTVGGIVMAAASWRTGEAPGYAESFA